MAAVRVLVAGDVSGNVAALLTKLGNVMKQAAFDVLLIAGSFLGPHTSDSVNVQELKLPLPTYFYGSYDPAYNLTEGKVAENLHYLGVDGVANLTGLKLGFQHTKGELHEGIRSESEGLDIFLSKHWPTKVLNQLVGDLPADVKKSAEEGCPVLSEHLSKVAPRYHFVPHPSLYFERTPYSTTLTYVSRFFGVAPIDNAAKQKSLYAFSIVPLVRSTDKAVLFKAPPLVTPDPYAVKGAAASAAPASGIDRRVGKRVREDPHSIAGSPECWFCLQNPDCDTTLVVSVGRDFYLALDKGGIVDDHVILVPIAHYHSFSELPTQMLEEMETYITQAAKMWLKKGCMTVIQERVLAQSRMSHAQLHLIPVPILKHSQEDVVRMLVSEASRLHISFQQVTSDGHFTELVQPDENYFLMEVRNGSSRARLLQRISDQTLHPMRFGREVLCRLLNLPQRVDWRACQKPKLQEAQASAAFRTAFKDLDTPMWGGQFPPVVKL